MAEFKGNPYYEPESCGLRLVWDEDIADSWEFDITAIWQDTETGDYYLGHDSGCSCPTPFEDFNGLWDMVKISEHEVKKYIRR